MCTLLELLDLEYLKPILIDRFDKLDDLACANLNDVGVQNQDDSKKLRDALRELQRNARAVEQYDPILSVKESDGIITRLENETNLVSSSLNLLLNNNTNCPRDDATFDFDYALYRAKTQQVETDVQQLHDDAEQLRAQIAARCSSLEQIVERPCATDANHFSKSTVLLATLAALCIGVMLYIKHK